MSVTSEKYECNISEMRISELIGDLIPLIDRVENDPKMRIEYGCPSQLPGGQMSFFRISKIQTAGGPQYRLCSLYLGTEGSGFYTLELPVLLQVVEKEIRRVHRKHKNPAVQKLLNEKAAGFEELDWKLFNVEDPATPPLAGLMNAKAEMGWMGAATTISLDAESVLNKAVHVKTHPHIIRHMTEWSSTPPEKIQRTIDEYKRHKAAGAIDCGGGFTHFAMCIEMTYKYRHTHGPTKSK